MAQAKPSTWLAFAGDWDGDGVDDPGLFDSAASRFHLAGPAGVGTAHWPISGVPVTGDWIGDAVCITWEAEAATTLVPPMQTAGRTDASDGSYVHVPNGSGANGSALYDFTLPSAGSYVVWGRTSGATGNDDSFSRSLQSKEAIRVEHRRSAYRHLLRRLASCEPVGDGREPVGQSR